MNSAVKIILGTILVLIPLFVAIAFAPWGHAVIELLKALVIIVVVVVGIILLILGISEVANR